MDQDAERNPEQQRERHHWAHDVISQELPKRVDVQFIDEVPETLHHVLNLLHTLPLQRHTHTRPVTLWVSGNSRNKAETHRSITEAHSAGFAFTQEQEVACCILVGSADATAAATADSTGRVGFCTEEETAALL